MAKPTFFPAETTRRRFLRHTGAALGLAAYCLENPIRLLGDPLGRPIGLQLYTVKEELAKDFDGTLRKVAAVGYKEVETAAFFDRSPKEFRAALDRVGLRCRSSHIWGPPRQQQQNIDRALEYANVLGATHVVTSIFAPQRANYGMQDQHFDFKTLTVDDFKSIAERCNTIGEQSKKAGLQLAYHNHNGEFRPLQNGSSGYDELLHHTDPKLVKFELDCGWMAVAGQNPATYIRRYPDRYRMLHIKDFKPVAAPTFSEEPASAPQPTELGRGFIDYKSIFAAAKTSEVAWYFVEQEPPFSDMPVMEAIQVDYDYLHNLKLA